MISEHEAELSYSKETEIEIAAQWCRDNYPHRFKFLNEIWLLLVAEERHFTKLGLTTAVKNGTIKKSPVLALLSPSQALRLLECFKRETINNPKVWKAKTITEINKIESKNRHDKLIADTLDQLRERRLKGD